MWFPHRVLRFGYATAARTGVFSTVIGRAVYESLYERFKLFMEGDTIAALSTYIVKDSLVLDVGANVGLYTHKFSQALGTTGKVIAIEADPDNAATLRHRFSGAPGVEVIEAAASDRSGTCRLEQDPFNPAGHVLGADGIEVTSVTIDDIVQGSSLPLSLIKIDVEGAEPLVIQGAVASIQKHMPAMLIEYSPERIGRLGGDPEHFLRTLRGFGYDFFVDSWTLPISVDDVGRLALKKGYVDVLLLAQKANPVPAH